MKLKFSRKLKQTDYAKQAINFLEQCKNNKNDVSGDRPKIKLREKPIVSSSPIANPNNISNISNSVLGGILLGLLLTLATSFGLAVSLLLADNKPINNFNTIEGKSVNLPDKS